MSDVNPPENPAPDAPEPTVPLAQPAPVQPTAPRRTRRTAIIVAVAVLVAAVLGGGAFAVYKVFFAGGPQPAEALPDSTIAILTVDLNPSAGQKIAAIKAIRKFPALRKNLGLQSQDDLRKFIFDKAVHGTDCDGKLSYSDDIKPWIGKRAAIAAVDLGEKNPTPALALQITDKSKAKAHVADLARCADLGSDFGYAIGKDYLIASDSTAHAQKILDDGQAHPLSKDAGYKKWTKAAGDQGVINFYVSKKASTYLADGLDQLAKSFTDGLGTSNLFGGSASGTENSSLQSYSGSSAPRATSCNDDPLGALKDQLKGFQGLAGTVRFADGGMELSVATSGVSQLSSNATVGDKVADLPGDTAIAIGFGVPEGYAAKLVDSFRCGAGADAVTQAEQTTGLKLPDDLQTLLGSAVTLSLGGDAPANLDDIKDPSEVPVGLLVHGDAEKIKALITKIEDTVGYQLSDISIGVKSSGDRLALSPSEAYANALLTNGSLGSSSSFKDAVPSASRDAGIFYVNFDSKWRETLIQLARDAGANASEVRQADENTKPLKSLGLSSWTSGGTSHLLLKLSTN
ncbi:MAG: DUF3352 domain-containing protein [Marmoricola sp.]